MTGLLVSVRDAVEAQAALAGGADLIDVKEPLRGALGYADPSIWREIQQAIGGRVPLSAALGELLADPVAKLAPQTTGLAFAKLGLAGCGSRPDWRQRWTAALNLLPATVAPVAVAYADTRNANAPSPTEILSAAIAHGVRTLLIDTYDKRGGSLLDHLPLPELGHFIAAAKQRTIQVVLAGSLTLEMLPQLLPLAPRYVAVRGAVCRGSRTGRIDPALVAPWATACHTTRNGATKTA